MTFLYNNKIGLFIEKGETLKKEPYTFYINETSYGKVTFSPRSGLRILLVGRPGAGKSYTQAIIINQFPNVIMIDPTIGGRFKDTLMEFGLMPDWNIHKISPRRGGNIIKFNISECEGELLINTLFGRKFKSEKQMRQKNALKRFLALPSEMKNWKAFKQMCKDNQLDHFLDEFKCIFSTKDDGISFDSIQKGKFLLETELNDQSIALGLFFSVLSWKRGNRRDIKFFGEDFLMLAADEIQKIAARNTALGDSITITFKELRKYGMGFCGAGSNYMGINPDIRKDWNYGFFYPAPGYSNQMKKEGIDLFPEEFNKLPEHGCFFMNREEMNNGAEWDREPFLPTKFFLVRRKMLAENSMESVVDGDTTNYSSVLKRSFNHLI